MVLTSLLQQWLSDTEKEDIYTRSDDVTDGFGLNTKGQDSFKIMQRRMSEVWLHRILGKRFQVPDGVMIISEC